MHFAVQRLRMHRAILECDLSGLGINVSKRVLDPIFIIAIGEVLFKKRKLNKMK